MKDTPLALFGFLLLTVPLATSAQTLLDDDFDSLALGDAPSVGLPAGAWFFPRSYVDASLGETNIAEFTIAVAPGDLSLNHCLRLTATTNDSGSQHLVNVFPAPLLESVGTKIVVLLDVYVPSEVAGGPSIYLGNGGWNNATQRGPQLTWHGLGTLTSVGVSRVETTLVSPYPRDVWQSVRLEIDLVSDTYRVLWGVRGSTLQQIGDTLPFRSGPQNALDRFTVARFSDLNVDVDAYVDNVSVTEVVVVPAGPTLALRPSGNAMVLSWPTNTTGFTLQSMQDLTRPSIWTDVTNPPAVTGGQFTVTNPISSPSQFFRLRKP
jgi:hypothetical protein